MEYNEKIAEITGQDTINHDILYSMHSSNYAVYKVIGDAGSGKKTLCEHIAESWIRQIKGSVIYLYASYRQTPEDYSTFKSLTARSERGKKLLNIFETALKDVPYVGNSLSAIASEIIDATNKKNDLKKYTENEQYIFSAIKKLAKDKDVLFLCFNYELWDLKSQHVLFSLLEYAESNFASKKTYFILISERKENILFDSKIQKKYLNKIQIEYIEEIAKQFNPNISLNPRQVGQLFELSEGNLELIKESLDLFQMDSLSISHSFYDIIQKTFPIYVTNQKKHWIY